MYGSWTEYVVLWTNYLGFSWDIKNVSTMYNSKEFVHTTAYSVQLPY